MKTKINEKPFLLVNFTKDEYLLWCSIHKYKPYIRDTKKLFFKKIYDFTLSKRNGIIFEDGKELKYEKTYN